MKERYVAESKFRDFGTANEQTIHQKKLQKAMTAAMQEECIRLTEKQTIAEKNKTNH